MKQLSGLDSMFVKMERRNQYAHVAGLTIYDPSSAAGGKVRWRSIVPGSAMQARCGCARSRVAKYCRIRRSSPSACAGASTSSSARRQNMPLARRRRRANRKRWAPSRQPRLPASRQLAQTGPTRRVAEPARLQHPSPGGRLSQTGLRLGAVPDGGVRPAHNGGVAWKNIPSRRFPRRRTGARISHSRVLILGRTSTFSFI